ncbi:hypothetical protein F5Y19DRAFT_477753 [Xylariaceae sp. FL1651]|nr:hypothetical protein F5Y19DRAFT_477753 [Xylariaceae sp. FL1651]
MASFIDGDSLGRPLSVKEISDIAQAFEWNDNIPFKAWLRTAQTLLQEANIYLREGNFSKAYLLFLRYSTLVLDLLKTHPEAKTPEARRALRAKILTIDVVLKNLERIKPLIDREYEDWQAAPPRKNSKPDHRRKESAGSQELSTYEQHASRDPALSYASRLLDAGQHQDLAVELAQKEIKRRDASRRATKKDGVAHHGEQDQRTAGFWDNWSHDIASKQAEDEEVFRKQMESTRKTLDGDVDPHLVDSKLVDPRLEPNSRSRDEGQHMPKPAALIPGYHYPKISKSAPIDYDPQRFKTSETQQLQPQRPPKQQETDRSRPLSPLAPKQPFKTPLYSDNPLPTPDNSQELPSRPPKLRESHTESAKKQHGVAFKPAAYLENGEPIRPIFLPRQLRHEFLSIASENTRRGLEMCGILCGTAVNNALFVRCLLIPEQKCTSDTCETENEGVMLDYCIEEELLMLGWIHTHPTQTCFMSSRDLHTQSGYQVMLPESIAIVCAPKFEPSYGIFRLTNPPGLSHVLNCTQSATFHAHAVDNLYTEAEHPPGHVYEHDNLDFYVQDLRPGARNSTIPNKKF